MFTNLLSPWGYVFLGKQVPVPTKMNDDPFKLIVMVSFPLILTHLGMGLCKTLAHEQREGQDGIYYKAFGTGFT